jgi:nitrous oxidase accessory protein NosD
MVWGYLSEDWGEFRGELLYEEPGEKVEQEAKTYREVVKWMAPLIIGLLVMLIFPLMLIGLELWIVLFYVLMLAFLAIYFASSWISMKDRPVERIYEKGFTEISWKKDEIFIPWSAIPEWKAKTWKFSGSTKGRVVDVTDYITSDRGLVMKGIGSKKKVISPRTDNFDRIEAAARREVGRGVGASGKLAASIRKKYRNIVIGSLVGAVFMGVLFSSFLFILAYKLIGENTVGIIFAALAITLICYGVLLPFTIADLWAIPRGLYAYVVPALGTIVILVLLAATISTYGLESMNFDNEVIDWDYPGGTVVFPEAYYDEEFVLEGPITLIEGQSIAFTNCTITFDLEYPTVFGIWIGKGAHIELVNTTVRPSNDEYYYMVEIYGSAIIDGCTFEMIGGNRDNHNGEGGLKIFNDDVIVRNTTFTRSITNAILVAHSSPQIIDCTVVDSWDDGIEITGGAPLVQGSSFEYCGFGAICFDGTKATFRDCTFIGNGLGMGILESHPTVEGSTFKNNRDQAIVYDTFSEPVLTDNDFEGNGEDVKLRRWWETSTHPLAAQMGELCIPVAAIIGFLSLMPFFVRIHNIQRRTRWADGERDRFTETEGYAIEDEEAPYEEIPANRGKLIARAPRRLRRSMKARFIGQLPKIVMFSPLGVITAAIFLIPIEGVGMIMVGMLLIGYAIVLMLIVTSWDAVHIGTEIYEGGVVVARPLRKGRFVPWGEFTNASEEEKSFRPKMLVLRGELWKVRIHETIKGYDEHKSLIDERIGSPKYKDHDPEDEPHHQLRRVFIGMVSIFFILATVVLAVYFRDGYRFIEVNPFVAIGMGYMVCFFFIFPFFVGWMFNSDVVRYLGANRKLMLRYAFIAGIVLFAGFIPVYMSQDPEIWHTAVDADTMEDPMTSFLEPGRYEDQEILADLPIVVRKGETFDLVNCTVRFRSVHESNHGIWVGRGGHLNLVNTTVEPTDPITGFYFEVHGTALVSGSTINTTADYLDSDDIDSGLEIYNEDVLVVNTTFNGALGKALSIHGCSPRIVGCTFNDSNSAGIDVYGGAPVIESCTFIDCYYGILLENSDALITDCTFIKNFNGIRIRWSDPTIQGCSFNDTNSTAIGYTGYECDPVLVDNTFFGNGANVYTNQGQRTMRYFLIGMIYYMLPLMMLFVFYERKRKKKSRWWSFPR